MIDKDADRISRCLAICRRRRQERVDRDLLLLDKIRASLLWRRLAGGGWWLGPPSRFPGGGELVDLQHLELPEDMDN